MFILIFSIQLTETNVAKEVPMIGFELRSSDAWNDPSSNCAAAIGRDQAVLGPYAASFVYFRFFHMTNIAQIWL